MDVNPYEPPGVPQEAEPALRPEIEGETSVAAPRVKRPLGLYFLCVFYLLMAVGIAYAGVRVSTLSQVASIAPVQRGLLIAHYALPCLLLAGGSVGLWLARRWGVYLAGLYQATRVVGTLRQIVLAPLVLGMYPTKALAGLALFTLVLQCSVHAAVMAYVLGPRVLSYCGVPLRSRLKLGVLLVALAAALLGVEYLLFWLRNLPPRPG